MNELKTDVAIVDRLEDSGTTLMRIENDMIASIAAAKPRDHFQIRDELVQQFDAYPTFAEKAVYVKPVGGGKYARGLSIRAAEALAEAYGYNRVRCEVSVIDADTVKIEATFTDLQKGRIWNDIGIISKFYKSRAGKIVRWDDDRFFNIVCKAEASKRIREVILRCVSVGLRSELQAIAERKMAGVLSGQGVQRIVEAFASINVKIETLENHIGRPVGAGWTEDDRVHLLGIYNAIADGELTIADAFSDAAPEADKPKRKAAPKSLEVAMEELAGEALKELETKTKTKRKNDDEKKHDDTV